MASTSLSNQVAAPSDAEEVNKDDTVILVLGAAGSGKSSFISSAAGGQALVGHKLGSCTKAVWPVASQMSDGRRLVLLDTPGLDISDISGIHLLENIVGWLASSYERGIRITGVVLLHPISDNRMTGASLRRLRLVSHLVGHENLRHLLFVSSMWDHIDSVSGQARETELCNDESYWQPFLRAGARHAHYHRSLPSLDSAKDAVFLLSSLPSVALKIQQEVVDQKLPLVYTEAGKVLDANLAQLADEQRVAISALEKSYQDSLRQKNSAFEQIEEDRKRRRALGVLIASITMLIIWL